MEAHSQIRRTDTPPESPRSCMKPTRKITFDESEPVAAECSSPKKVAIKSGVLKSPRVSTARVSIGEVIVQSEAETERKSKDIEFQFHLSQHYEQSTPPPNCTSDPHFVLEEKQESEVDESAPDPRLVEIASKFVNEIIETAKVEVAKREQVETEQQQRRKSSAAAEASREFLANLRGPWMRRAQGTVSKWITNICVRAQNSMKL